MDGIEISIPIKAGEIQGTLTLPPDPVGMVLFAHGSGSSRLSPRNRFVAGILNDAGLGTLLMDLLTRREERIDSETAHLRFDINLLAERLRAAAKWVLGNAATHALPLGYFGSSTGAGAALVAATDTPGQIQAIVSRGGRPDLAGPALARVEAPTLLIVGGRDWPVIELNKSAQEMMHAPTRLEIVPHATHLFEESGALERVAKLARDWFITHFAAVPHNHP